MRRALPLLARLRHASGRLDVCKPGKNGSDRQALKTALMTQIGSGPGTMAFSKFFGPEYPLKKSQHSGEIV